MRKLKWSKFGPAEDPGGLKIAVDALNGIGWRRSMLLDVVGVRRDDILGATFLKTRRFNGKEGPDVAYLDANVIE
jgi:hypothetical protein